MPRPSALWLPESQARARNGSALPRLRCRVRSESLFPVFLATAVFAVGWAAVLWDTRFVTDPSGPWDVLK